MPTLQGGVGQTGGGEGVGGGAPTAGGSSSGQVGGGTAGGSIGTPVTIAATTATAAIPANSMACSGSSLGSKGDLDAINVPLIGPGVSVSTLTLRYDLGSYLGEPTRRAVVSWAGMGALSSVAWLAEVHDVTGKQYVTRSNARVFASFQPGALKGPGAGFGTDSTGSPSWAQTFVTWDAAAGNVMTGVTDLEAKGIYRNCFRLANLRLFKLNGSAAAVP